MDLIVRIGFSIILIAHRECAINNEVIMNKKLVELKELIASRRMQFPIETTAEPAMVEQVDVQTPAQDNVVPESTDCAQETPVEAPAEPVIDDAISTEAANAPVEDVQLSVEMPAAQSPKKKSRKK